MHTIVAKANSQPQVIKNLQIEELKVRGQESIVLIALPHFNNSKFSAKAWQKKKIDYRQYDQ